MPHDGYRIGEAAKRLGMNPRTIRFWEAARLLPELERTPHGHASAGHRLFRDRDLRRLAFVRQARLVGLSLDEIRALVGTAADGCCGRARPLLARLIEDKLVELRRRARDLIALDRMLRRAPRGARMSCDGTPDRCLPLTDRPLLQISLPRRRHRQASARSPGARSLARR